MERSTGDAAPGRGVTLYFHLLLFQEAAILCGRFSELDDLGITQARANEDGAIIKISESAGLRGLSYSLQAERGNTTVASWPGCIGTDQSDIRILSYAKVKVNRKTNQITRGGWERP